MHNRLSKKDVDLNNGALMYGRIRKYSRSNGFGFICTENGKDIFLSSYDLCDSEKKYCIGSLVSFIPAFYKEKIIASNVLLLNKYPSGCKFYLPNGLNLSVKNIQNFGLVSGKTALSRMNVSEEAMLEAGYSYKDLEHIFIKTKEKEYKFYNHDSKINGDGQTDLDNLIKKMNDFFLNIYWEFYKY